ncbi:MAG: hypothetical protein IH624_15715 [Phycisphaerae bacterium]|nr:hypothetical protein [Phycisphaerae bacterium]
MNWSKKNNILIMEIGREVHFGFPIKGINGSSCLTYIQVDLDVPLDQTTVENSYFVSKEDGEITAKYVVGRSSPPCYAKDKSKEVIAKGTKDWGKDGNTLIIQDDTYVTFCYPIGTILETCGNLLIVLDVPAKQSMPENLFAVSEDGEILWQIEHSPKTGLDPANRFTGVRESSISGIVVASNWNCVNFYVDVKTGRVVDTEFTK